MVLQQGRLSNASLTAFHDSYAQLDRALRHYDFMVDAVLADPRISRASAKFLRRIWYSPAPGDAASLAQRAVRQALTQAMMLTLLHHSQADARARHGPSRLCMFSTVPSSGYSSVEAPKLPLDRVTSHFERCSRRRGLEGVGLMDLALVQGPEDCEPTELGIHFHAACRQTGLSTRPSDGAAHEIPSSKKNKHGLSVGQVSVKASPLSSWDVAGLVYYVTKISCGLKPESASATRTEHQHWQPEHALRALEVLSHVAATDALHAVGEWGRALKAESEARAERFLGNAPLRGAKIEHSRLQRGWARLYQELELEEWRPARLAA